VTPRVLSAAEASSASVSLESKSALLQVQSADCAQQADCQRRRSALCVDARELELTRGQGAAAGAVRWTWQVMRAAVAVEAGEELGNGYVEVGAPTHVRRAALHKGYCFHCQCARCVQTDQALATEESADRTLVGLRCAAPGCGQLACAATADACESCGADLSPLQVFSHSSFARLAGGHGAMVPRA